MITHYCKAIALPKSPTIRFPWSGHLLLVIQKISAGIGLLDTMVMLFPNTADPILSGAGAILYSGLHASAVKILNSRQPLRLMYFSTLLRKLSISFAQQRLRQGVLLQSKRPAGEIFRVGQNTRRLAIFISISATCPNAPAPRLKMLRFGADPQK